MDHPLLNELNARMRSLHTAYEDLFWTTHMGDHSFDEQFMTAKTALDAFRADRSLSERVDEALKSADGGLREKLAQWQWFFSCYQSPVEALALREQAHALDVEAERVRSSRKEGYVDPDTGAFVEASKGKMRLIRMTNDDERVRKACFDALEQLGTLDVRLLIEQVKVRNAYARAVGDEDFYAYKLRIGEGMTKKELFDLCDEIFERTKYGFDIVRELEKSRPGLRKPWNYGYMMRGDFKKKKDPYLQFGDALMRWGRSFQSLGITYRGSTLQLDLLDRKGKYNNGFCHWPGLVYFEGGTRHPGHCNFTSNAVPGQVGAGENAIHTLFHEGGHAAHLLNVDTTEACMNHEYAPLPVAWAETHSQFLDTMQDSPEWLSRYARDASGAAYPFALIEEEIRCNHPDAALDFMAVLRVVNFERELYSTPDLTEEKVLDMARRSMRKHYDFSEDSVAGVLDVPHIYDWESSCYYHGYGLADLMLRQWRERFYNDYGYIVDNPNVGPDMCETWKPGASKTLAEFVKLATGKKLTADAYLADVTATIDEKLARAKERIERLASVPMRTDPIDLDGIIRMVDGKELIADNAKGFEDMAEKYRQWYFAKEASVKRTA